MFEKIINFLKGLSKKEQQENPSKDTAKERLHLVLMQDRANVSADFLELMKQEIIEVIKKYIDVDENSIDVRLTNKQNDDGTTGAPALYANIPIVNVRNDMKKEVVKEENYTNYEEETKEETESIENIEQEQTIQEAQEIISASTEPEEIIETEKNSQEEIVENFEENIQEEIIKTPEENNEEIVEQEIIEEDNNEQIDKQAEPTEQQVEMKENNMDEAVIENTHEEEPAIQEKEEIEQENVQTNQQFVKPDFQNRGKPQYNGSRKKNRKHNRNRRNNY